LWNGLLEESLFYVVEGMPACKQEKHAPQPIIRVFYAGHIQKPAHYPLNVGYSKNK
jgi:hypothetical protein